MDVIWLCQENIKRFRNQLAETQDNLERRILLDLLRREEILMRQVGRAKMTDIRRPE
jgi:hypothetical protein